MVILPVLLRPPEEQFVFTIRLFSGLSVVISSNPEVILYLNVGVSGLYFFNAIVILFYRLYTSVKIDCFALFQSNDSFFVAVNPANGSTTGSVAGLYLTNVLLGIDRINFNSVHFFYSCLYL